MDEAWRLHSLCVCVPIFGLVLVELLGYYTEYKDNKYISPSDDSDYWSKNILYTSQLLRH